MATLKDSTESLSTTLQGRHSAQGRIQDLKLGGVHLKKIARSRGRGEKFWGISCEKSRFYAKKIIFFPILGGRAPGAPPPPWIRPRNRIGGGNRSTKRKPPTCPKSLTNFITLYCIGYSRHEWIRTHNFCGDKH